MQKKKQKSSRGRNAARAMKMLYNYAEMAKTKNYVLRITEEFGEALEADAKELGFKRSPSWVREGLGVVIGRPDLVAPDFSDIEKIRHRLDVIESRLAFWREWLVDLEALHKKGEGQRHDLPKRKRKS